MAHDSASDRDSFARLQAGLAATLERADRAEIQLRTATEESLRLSGRVELLEQELADAKRGVAKSREETVAMTALAATHGARAVELEREAIALREKTYQLGLDLTVMATERDRLTSELSGLQLTVTDMTAARSQSMIQLEEAAKQHGRITAAAAAAEDRHKAEMQQLQVRLAATEAECRALHHAKGTMHEDLQRARSDILTLQAQTQEEARQREEHASECRRLQRELETSTEGLAHAQRSHRTAATAAEQVEEELERLRTAHSAVVTELQAAKDTVLRLQDESRLATERNADLASQLHAIGTTVRNLEAENLRLADGHATLRVEVEARAAEARAARGEAAELAADRARLLAELQRKPAGGDDDEANRLREALSASRLEVARLQRELAANDAVLADAESALVALVSEKEGLQQALSVALMSARVAVDTAEEIKARAAASSVQETATEQLPATAPDIAMEALRANGADQHMMSFLQSLHDDGSTPQSSESYQGQSSVTAGGRASPRHGSAASSATTTASVRVPGPSAQVGVARYPAQPTRSTSETGSIVQSYTRGQNEAWEALSVSSAENSGKETGSGDGAATYEAPGRPSATSLVVAPFSVTTQVPQPQGAPKAPRSPGSSEATAARAGFSMPGDGLVLAPAGPSSRDGRLPSPARVTAPAAPSGTHWGREEFRLKSGLEAVVSSGGNDAPTEAVPAVVTTATSDGASATSFASSEARSYLLPPRSPQSSISDLRELDNNAASSTTSLSHGGDMGSRPVGLFSASSSQPVAAAAASGFTAAAKSPTPSRLPSAGLALHAAFSAPVLDAYRSPPPAYASLAPFSPLHPASTASDGPFGAGSVGYAATAAASPGGGGAGAYFSALSVLRGPDALGSALAGRSAISAEVASTLQGSAYRSPSRVNLVGARTGFTACISSTSTADGNERGTASRPTSVGGAGAGGGSPMISPRVMMDSRMLSRAVRPSAEALSSALRPSSAIPGSAGVVETGAAGSQQVLYGDGVGSKASVSLVSASSHLQQQLGRQQQTATTAAMTTPAYRKPMVEPDLSTYQSPFASGSSASAIASPIASATVTAVAVASPSPKPSGTVRMAAPSPSPAAMHSFDLLSQRVSKEQHTAQSPALTSSPASISRPSLAPSFARRTTLTQERGVAGNVAVSVPATADVFHQQMRAADGAPGPQMRDDAPSAVAPVKPALMPSPPSEEDAMLLKRLAAMDDALRAIGAI